MEGLGSRLVCDALVSDLQHYTFYDFIINKARGKSGKQLLSRLSQQRNFLLLVPKLYFTDVLTLCILLLLHAGPLFSFDVHEDVRLLADATVEKDEVPQFLSIAELNDRESPPTIASCY